MKFKITGSQLCGVLIVALSAWILQSFLIPLLVACVTAIASWPLYRRFAASLPERTPRGVASLIFTSIITAFVLVPLMFAVGALLTETHALLLDIAAADQKGIAVPTWVENLPLAGSWLTAALAKPNFSAGRALALDGAGRSDYSFELDAVTRSIRRPTLVHHRIHDLDTIFPLPDR